METFLINSGSVERVRENGREYLVADATILVGDQVLNGSKGKLFYPSRRCALNVGEWNKQPIVLRHPTERNSKGETVPVAAHKTTGTLNDEIIRQFGMGEVRNDSWDGKHRRVKLWFDAEHTQNKSPETYQALVDGKSIELSTGLFTQDKPVANGRSPSGDEYTHEVEDWTPDHLAILPDQVGACSRKMGCGVLNSSTDSSLLRRIAEKLGLVDPPPVTNECKCKSGDEECTCDDPKKCKSKKTDNAFCPTGKGGGQDNSCSSKDGGGGGSGVGESLGIKTDTHGMRFGMERTRSADEASAAATDATGHKKAQHLHERASSFHRDQAKGATEEDVEQYHLAKERYHDEKAEFHSAKTTRNSTEGDDMSFDRTKTIQTLAANCACWKGKEKALNAMDDDALAILAKQSEEMANNQLVVNAVRSELGIDASEELTANAMPAFIQAKIDAKKKGKKAVDEEEDEEEPTENVFKDFLKLPPEQRLTANERETLEFANEVKQRARAQLVDNLVAILGRTPERKAELKKKYSALTVNQLREKLDELKELDIPAERPTINHAEQDTVLDYLGAGGGYTGNRGFAANEVNPDDILDPFYTEEPAAAK